MVSAGVWCVACDERRGWCVLCGVDCLTGHTPTQASGPAGTIVAADAPGSPDLYKCSQCKRKLANRKGAFDKKMQQKIRNKKRRQGSSHRCQQCETTDCRIVHDLVCTACSMKA